MEKIVEKRIIKIANFIFGKDLENEIFNEFQYGIIEILERMKVIHYKTALLFKEIYSNKDDIEKVNAIVKKFEKEKN